MKPIAIFRHVAYEGPGYLASLLDARRIPWQLIRIDQRDAVPSDAGGYSGLVFMGGPMSVNDDLPWIAKSCALIRDAVARDVPVLGHCLGGQLMSKALGGMVSKGPVKEIGWGAVSVSDNDIARHWFGDLQGFDAFHWHGETFSLPQGATHLLSSVHCVNQGYAIGPHLALQCHIEMTDSLIAEWCEVGANEIADAIGSPGVQSVQIIRQQAAEKLPQLHQTAERLYSHWITGLRF